VCAELRTLNPVLKIIPPTGNVLLVDPWLTNPVFAEGKDEVAALKRVDLIWSRMDIPNTSETRSRSENERERNSSDV